MNQTWYQVLLIYYLIQDLKQSKNFCFNGSGQKASQKLTYAQGDLIHNRVQEQNGGQAGPHWGDSEDLGTQFPFSHF